MHNTPLLFRLGVTWGDYWNEYGCIGVEIWKNIFLALEYLHDEDYSVNAGGTGNNANGATAKLAVVP